MVLNNQKKGRGFSLVEVLIVAALMLVVFGSIFTTFRYSLDLIAQSRAKLSALTLANERMEYIHSLAYDAVGTVLGAPAGAIAQTSTTSLNNIIFTETVLIEYVDDAADGVGASDSNGISTDYKRTKVTIGWTTRGVSHEIFLVSNIIPRSIETNVGGGTLRVNVFDAVVQPLPGAQVRVWNTTGTSSIDVTRSTDATGAALFGGVPAGAGYQISVTAPGYSVDQTYAATTSLPNPTTQPVAVQVADISTMNFFIDRVSSLVVTTLLDKTASSSTSVFTTMDAVASSSFVTTTGAALALAAPAGTYTALGTAYLDPVEPVSIVEWDTIVITATTTAATEVRAYVYTGTSTYTLVSNSDLPSNNNGFTGSTIDISRLNPVTYPNLTVQLQLTTASSTQTPLVQAVAVHFVSSKTVAPNVSFTMRGTKTIGTLADSSPVYKYSAGLLTDGTGVTGVTALEWDAYVLAAPGYDVAEACPSNPVSVTPGASSTIELMLTTGTAHSLRVVAQTVGGTTIPGATITLSRPGYSSTVTSSSCGQAFFGGVASETDYTLDVSVAGYSTQSFSGVAITGGVVQTVTF